jgi:predicted restriction endonuclease
MLVARKRLRQPRRRRKDGRYSPEYWAFRKEVLKRDQFTCQFPGCMEKKNLEVHHIKKYAASAKLRTEKFNGITLCKQHHEMVTGKEELFESEFFKIVTSKNIKEIQKLNELGKQRGIKKSTKNIGKRYIRKRYH